MTPLVTKKFVYELIFRVHWPEDPGEVGLQMAPDVLGDEGLGGLGGVEAVHGLYQLVDLPTVLHPLVQHGLEGVRDVVNVKLVKLLLLGEVLEDAVEPPRVFRGYCPQGFVAVHPASTRADLETVEPSVHVLVLEILPVHTQGMVSIGHRLPEETGVDEPNQDDVTSRGQFLFKELETLESVVVELLLCCLKRRVLTVCADIVA